MSQEFDVFRCEASGGRPVPEVSWWNQTNKVPVRGRRYSLISLILNTVLLLGGAISKLCRRPLADIHCIT